MFHVKQLLFGNESF